MRTRTLIILILFAPIPILGQEYLQDTIPQGKALNGIKGEYIYQTTIDTVTTLVINELLARNSTINTDQAGDYDDWFEIYNYGELPIKLNNLWFSDDSLNHFKWKIDTAANIYIYPGHYMVFWADDEQEEGFNHTSFKLSGSGEYLAIWSKDSALIDEIYFEEQHSDISHGRYPDGGQNWQYYTNPSPGEYNNSTGSGFILPQPMVSQPGGIFHQPLALKLSTDIEGCEIWYTLDCKDPDSRSILFEDSIWITESTIIRAKLIKEGHLDGKVLTVSYLFEETNFDNPVISLVSNPNNFYGAYGLISTNSRTIEIPANFEFIENGEVAYSGGSGIQLHSVKSTKPNSMRLYARNRYGNEWFEHDFFANDAPPLHKRLVLRNSGNDNVNKKESNSHYRDPLASAIAKASNTNALTSASRPVNVFLNGKYYGLFNLRERIDEYYIETHTSETKDFDLLERSFGYGKNRHAVAGSFEEWNELLRFVDTTGNLSSDADLGYVNEQVDLVNFTDYWITEVFLGNFDWLSNNVKFWKSESGKWQWIYWDMDHCLGLVYNSFGNVDWNTLQWSLGFSDRAWPNGFNNILIRNLLKNQSYKEYFIRRFTYLLNTSLSFDQTAKIADAMKSLYKNDMKIHANAWERDMDDWLIACDTIKGYLKYRPAEQMKHLQDYFMLAPPVNLSMKVLPKEAGTLSVSEFFVTSDSVSASFFPKLNYKLAANPIPGYTLHKLIINQIPHDSTTFYLNGNTQIKAVFMPKNSNIPITLTEVYFNNYDEYDSGDWIEFYNFGLDTFDLSGAQIIGAKDRVLYTFDPDTKIGPDRYFVIAENKDEFRSIYTGDILCFGDLKSGSDDPYELRLQSGKQEVLTDNELMNAEDWPKLPSEGFSIELNSLIKDSNDGVNWELSKNRFGSPGIPNEFYYIFHRPNGKDSVYSSLESVRIPFISSDDFYFDIDGHELDAIFVGEISGPGRISAGIGTLESQTLYAAEDFFFEPHRSHTETTSFTYYFIDKSGQKSKIHSIQFTDILAAGLDIHENIKHYPSPASSELFIELPKENVKDLEFIMFDISGKIAESFTLSRESGKLRIDLQHLTSGIYFFRLKLNDAIYHGKVEVMR